MGDVVHVSAFDAGKNTRRLRAIPNRQIAINSQIRAYGKTVVSRSRYLAANNPYAAMAKEEFVASFVGNGIMPSSLISDPLVKQEIQETFLEWTDQADADNVTDFYGLQGVMAGEMFEAGECFVRIRSRRASDGLTVPFQLQLLPSEMCPTDMNQILPGGRRIECGIQFNAIGQREGYWFYKNHPLELLAADWGGNPLVFVPASEVLHLFKPVRAGQIRGIPHTLAGMVTLAMLDLYDDAELERKRTAALFAGFITRKAAEDENEYPLAGTPQTAHDVDGDQTDDKSMNYALEPGAMVDLDDGQDVKFAEPADVGGNYESFEYRNLLRAAAGFGTPYASMTGDLRQASYGSNRAGLVTFRRRVEMLQNAVLIFQFCRPIWKRFLETGIVAGVFETFTPSDYDTNQRAFLKVKWIPPKWEWIDPYKDRMAEKLAVDSGFKARSDVIEAEGYDAEEVDRRIAADQARAKRLGLQFIQLPNGLVVSPIDDSLLAPGTNSGNSPAGTGGPNGRKRARTRGGKPTRYIWDR